MLFYLIFYFIATTTTAAFLFSLAHLIWTLHLRGLLNLTDRLKAHQSSHVFRNTPQVKNPRWLPVTEGKIPSWLNGILYRIGPGRYNLGVKEGQDEATAPVMIRHAFDGMPFMHRFELSAEKQAVRYNSRHLCESVERRLVKTGGGDAVFFGHLPEVQGGLQRLFAIIQRHINLLLIGPVPTDDPSALMVGVTATPNYPVPWPKAVEDNRVLVAKTDLNALQDVHPDTLEPRRLFTYAQYDKRLKGDLAAAHHQYDPITGEVFNIDVKLGPRPKIKVFSITESGQVTVLAEITHRKLLDGRTSRIRPAYIHSFWLTQNYVIIPESPLYYQGVDLIITGTAVSGLVWDEASPTFLHIVSRRPGAEHLVTLEAASFFTFHVGNAWDTVDAGGEPVIHLDCGAFPNGDILYQLDTFGHPLRSGEQDVRSAAGRGRLRGISMPQERQSSFADLHRYTLRWSSDEGSVTCRKIASNIEFLRFSQKYAMRPYRYLWGCELLPATAELNERYCLVKVDLETGALLHFEEPDFVCSEPIFVPPSSSKDTDEEDDGVLLSFVNVHGNNTKEQDHCLLLVLDAKTMTKMASCNIGTFKAVTFHGSFVDQDFQNVSMN